MWILSLSLLFVLHAPAQALAHATPITYTPSSQAVVTTLPEYVEIHFTERIEPGASSIRIFAPDGSAAHSGSAYHTQSERHFGIALEKEGEKGVYTVSWQVVSADDGHFTKGAFAFLYGDEGATFDVTDENVTGQIQILHVTTLPEATLGLINLLGQACIIGALLVFGYLGRKLQSEQLRVALMRSYRRVFLVGLCSMILGTLGFIVIKTLDLAQLRSTSFVETLQTFIESNAGSFALTRLLLGFALVCIFLLTWRKIRESSTFSRHEWLLLIITFFILYAQSKVSHAAASHFLPEISVVVTAVHLFAKEVLVGGALAALALFNILLLSEKKDKALTFLATYGRFAALAILGTGVTGTYITWLHLKNVTYLSTSEWGGLFLLLLIFGVLLVFFRVLGTVLLYLKRFLVWLRPLLLLEFLIGIVMLFFSGYISITTPPYLVEDYTLELRDESGDLTTTLRPHIFESDKLLLEITDEQGALVDVDELIVSVQNEPANIGPIVVDTTQRYNGGYLIPEATLQPNGMWDIRAVLKRDGEYDEHAHFTLKYPEDIDASRVNNDVRNFDTFAITFVLIAILVILFVILLYKMSARRDSGFDGAVVEWGGTFHKVAPYLFFVLLLLIVWISHEHFLKSEFQKRCEADNNFWIQSAVMRNGETLSPNTVTGCTLDLGLFHIATLPEYEYYFKDSSTLETRAELTLEPEIPLEGEETTIELELSRIEDGVDIGPIEELTIAHDRKLHLLLIGEDMQTFAHIHPETSEIQTKADAESGIFRIIHTFPKAGRYILLADYVVKGREIQKQFFIDVAGSSTLAAAQEEESKVFEKDGYRVTLDTPETIQTGELTKMTFTIEKDGEPADTLGAYLAAPMHVAVIRHDFEEPLHTHGEVYLPGSATFQGLFADYITYHSHFVPAAFGPKVQARLTFDEPGTYQIFAEFLHNDDSEENIVASTFTVRVE